MRLRSIPRRLLLIAVYVGAGAVLVHCAATHPPYGLREWYLAALLAAAETVMWLYPISILRLSARTEHTADACLLVAASMAMPAELAVPALLVGIMVSTAVADRNFSLSRTNDVAMFAVTAFVSMWAGTRVGSGLSASGVGGAALTGFLEETTSLIVLAVGLVTIRRATFLPFVMTAARETIIVWPWLICIGIVLGTVALTAPWVLPLTGAPLVLLLVWSRSKVAATEDRARLDGLLSSATAILAAVSIADVIDRACAGATAQLGPDAYVSTEPGREGELDVLLPTQLFDTLHLIVRARDRAVYANDYSDHDRRVMATLASITSSALNKACIEVQARDKADQVSRAKSEFLSRMSHELRTPLNAVIGFAELLELGPALETTQRDYVSTILRAGDHLLGLINDVLDIARIEEGGLALAIELVPVEQLVRDAVELVRPLAAVRNITLSDRISGIDGVQVLADRQHAKQVLLNLLSNAVKYNRAAGAITIAVHSEGGRTRLEVADTGPGIAPVNLPKLFAPFERLDAVRTGIEGTGLGLALSLRLAQSMGGAMGVRSTLGEGTTFWFDLPTAGQPARLPASGEVHLRATPSKRYRARHRVLYIEDTLSNVRLLEGIVASRSGLELVPAMQGRRGLEVAEQWAPHLILLDLNLPDMAGSDVLRALRTHPATRTIPVVVVSADATQSQIERMVGAGADAYLTKPLGVREVLDTIDRLLGEDEAAVDDAAGVGIVGSRATGALSSSSSSCEGG